jgi:hypothetical protein
MADSTKDRIIALLKRLEVQLNDTAARLTSMAALGVDAGQARSLELLRSGIDVAIENFAPVRTAVVRNNKPTAVRLTQELMAHVSTDIARPQVLDDLEGVIEDAEEEEQGRVGRHRNPVREFITHAKALENDIALITTAAIRVGTEITTWAQPGPEKETDMARKNENLKAIEAAIQQVGRQLSFLATRKDRATGTTPGEGVFKNVTAQMISTLDALGMPHHGVQFAKGRGQDMSRDTLIESLMAEFSEKTRNGNTVYTLGEGQRRITNPEDGRMLAGAAKSAARRVRAEADNILDILDRLPDMARFQTGRDVVSVDEARMEVENRFVDLDEVMADPYGVNIARALFAIRRVLKGLLDYFDYANLEPEFTAAVTELNLDDLIPDGLLPATDVDELSQRRSPTLSEELKFEIVELVQAFGEMVQDVLAPLSNTRGNAAARLELSLTSAYGSARDLRDILVRTGTALSEQDLITFTSQIRAQVVRPTRGEATRISIPFDLSVGQVMDWILEVTEPFTGASFRANVRERGSLAILAAELRAQNDAIADLISSASEFGFAISLPGPMRQLEELKFLIETAEAQATILASPNLSQTG